MTGGKRTLLRKQGDGEVVHMPIQHRGTSGHILCGAMLAMHIARPAPTHMYNDRRPVSHHESAPQPRCGCQAHVRASPCSDKASWHNPPNRRSPATGSMGLWPGNWFRRASSCVAQSTCCETVPVSTPQAAATRHDAPRGQTQTGSVRGNGGGAPPLRVHPIQACITHL